ncbi:hypothetical protein FGA82_19900 [Pseudomonas fluorescens]|nr:hypothetical protein FGA82_19900 [Pseudomonas fluorescens]
MPTTTGLDGLVVVYGRMPQLGAVPSNAAHWARTCSGKKPTPNPPEIDDTTPYEFPGSKRFYKAAEHAHSRRERGLTEVFGRSTPTWHTEPSSDSESDQKPLTLALPKRRTARRERGLTEVFGRVTPTCDTALNSDSEMPTNRLPLPRERAGRAAFR